MHAIEIAGLRKQYPNGWRKPPVEALRGVDLQVRQGSALGLIGPNGAGKTTLLKILLGLVTASDGQVRVFGGAPSELAVRRRIGYLPERLYMPASFTARGFLASVARLKGVPVRELDRQLERVGMAHARDEKIGRFSKGMKQRVGLAAALLGAPDLLVLDEPTDGIDPQGRADVRQILIDEHARGATVLLNSHLISETERICDDVCILARGQVVQMGQRVALCGDAQRWCVRFAGSASPEQLQALGFTPQGEEHLIAAEDAEALNAQLDLARAQGALLVELRPAMRTLEDVLLASTRGQYGG